MKQRGDGCKRLLSPPKATIISQVKERWESAREQLVKATLLSCFTGWYMNCRHWAKITDITASLAWSVEKFILLMELLRVFCRQYCVY